MRVLESAAPKVLQVEIADERPLYAALKRAMDILLSLVMLLLFGPLFLILAVLVKLSSKGPVIYRQSRVGLGGREFVFFKLRSMVDGAEAMLHEVADLNITGGPTFKHPEDPRITPIGRFLRKTSLDELPQLFNVLRGDMSLVGPRPPLPREVAEYGPREMRRLSVKPGISCLWQVNGRSDLSFDQQVDLDLQYIERRSLPLDVWILLCTVPAVLTGRGAC